jgi:lathosterol oxidase
MSGYSMQPAETIFDSLIPSLVILLLVPVHPVVFGIFWWIDTVWSVMGHSGIEIFPRGTPRHWLGRWLNTPTAHSLHHTAPRYNYGFYFLFWDRLCGTVHPEYERHFEAHLNPAAVPANMRPAS